MKDYAHNYRHKKNNRLKHTVLNLFLWAVILSLGYIVYHHQKNLSHKKKTTHVDNHKKTTPVTYSGPKLDFYTLLPQEKVPASPNLQATPSTINPNNYYLQIATSTSLSGSTRLAEKLGTEGYSAFVVSMSDFSPKRYRIMVGPFTQLNSATLNQNLLKNNSITSILIKPNRPQVKNIPATT